MNSFTQKVQTVASGVFALGAVACVVLAIVWPAFAAETLRSRLAVSLLAIWSLAMAIILHPVICAGLAQGMREFRKAERELFRGDDDDDDPHAA
jgi:hypothetical protein